MASLPKSPFPPPKPAVPGGWIRAVRLAALASVLLYWSAPLVGEASFSTGLGLLVLSALFSLLRPFWVPYLLVAWRVRSNPARWLGWAAGWGAFMLCFAVLTTLIVGVGVPVRGAAIEMLGTVGLMFLPAWQGNARWLPWLWGSFAVVQAALVISAVVAYSAIGKERRPGSRLGKNFGLAAGKERRPGSRLGKNLGLAVVCALVVLLVFGVWLLLIKRSERESLQPMLAVGAVRDIYTNCVSYAYSFPDEGFPVSLAELQRVGLKPELADGENEGYRFKILPGLRDASGRVTSCAVVARPVKYDSRLKGPPSFLASAEGVLYRTQEDRDPTPSDHPI